MEVISFIHLHFFVQIFLHLLVLVLSLFLKIYTMRLFCCFQKESLLAKEVLLLLSKLELVPLFIRFSYDSLIPLLNPLSLELLLTFNLFVVFPVFDFSSIETLLLVLGICLYLILPDVKSSDLLLTICGFTCVYLFIGFSSS